MSYCNKKIKATNILNDMSDDNLSFTLASCEQTCDRYYRCDLATLMQDRLEELQGELLKCPHCGLYQEFCNFPDLFYSDASNSKDINEQLKLLEELQTKGFNVVSCGHCGQVFIHRIQGE